MLGAFAPLEQQGGGVVAQRALAAFDDRLAQAAQCLRCGQSVRGLALDELAEALDGEQLAVGAGAAGDARR